MDSQAPSRTEPGIPGDDPAGGRNQNAIGLGLAVATTIIAALQPVVMRYGAVRVDPLIFSTIAMVAAAVSGSTVAGFCGELPTVFKREYAFSLFAVSLTGSFATSLLLIYGLRRIDAVAAVILLESEPVYSLLLARIFLGERPSKRQLAATAAILGGIGSVFMAGRAFRPYSAAALVLLTPLFWQISHVISLRLMPPVRPLAMTCARYLYAAVVLVAAVLVLDRAALAELVNFKVVIIAGLTGALVYFAGSLTWYGAISRLSLSWTTAFVIPGVPILAFGFAIAFLGEHPSLRELTGISIAIIGVTALVTGWRQVGCRYTKPPKPLARRFDQQPKQTAI